MEDSNKKINSIKEKKRIVDAIHSTEKRINFLEKDIINVIGLNTKGATNYQHLGVIGSIIQQKQQQKFNKSKSVELLFNLPVETDDNFELFDREACNKKIDNEKKNLFNKQQEIRQNITKFKELVEKKENNLKYLESLKSLMETIESNIVLYKENQKNTYEELLISEKRLTQELSIFQEHLNDWEEKKSNKDWFVGRNSYTHGLLLKKKITSSFPSPSNSNIDSTPVPPEITLEAKSIIKYGFDEGIKRFNSMKNLTDDVDDILYNDSDSDFDDNDDSMINSIDNANKKYIKNESKKQNKNKPKKISKLKSTFLYDVERFRNFYVRNHGRNGGWDELSHSMFEKIWKKIGPNNSRFEQTCLDSIPGLDLMTLEKHIEWYKTYQELLQRKKNAIENWRSENKKKRIENQKNLNINPSHIELEIKNKLAKEKRRKELEHRQKVKQKLKLWKEKKRLEEEKENYIAEEEKKKEKEMEDKKLQIKQKINKEKLKIYNEEKKKHELSIKKSNNNSKKENDIKEKKKVDLKYFQEKDRKYLNKKLQRKINDLKEENEKELRLEKIKSVYTIVVERDPNRILQPTKTFQNYVNSIHHHNKTKNIFSSIEHVNAFFNPNELQHRAVPVWRKGVSS